MRVRDRIWIRVKVKTKTKTNLGDVFVGGGGEGTVLDRCFGASRVKVG